jgi:predicted house-cleaning noncanonical NTP pyrophosphatase (MazG superfamily)
MHGKEGDNLPKEIVQGPLSETAANETLQQTVHETVSEIMQETIHEPVSETVQETINETGRDTLLDIEVFDALDKMIRDGEPEFLGARNLKKLEQMRKDAKTPLFNGSSMTN